MSIKDQIRAEIERLIRMNQTKNGFPAGTNCAIRIESYEHLISFLDSLPERPVDGPEEAADAHIRRVADAAGHPGWDWTTQDIAEAFIAGAEWMAGPDQLGAPLHGRVWNDGEHLPGLVVDSAQLQDHLKGFPDGAKVDIFIIAKEDK
jgi:hypothetical protein